VGEFQAGDRFCYALRFIRINRQGGGLLDVAKAAPPGTVGTEDQEGRLTAGKSF
jgi:hypothetical protein